MKAKLKRLIRSVFEDQDFYTIVIIVLFGIFDVFMAVRCSGIYK